MKNIALLSAFAIGVTCSLSGVALALPASPGRIPNGAVFGCKTCHPGNDVHSLNEMGKLTQGIRHALIQPEEWWTILYNIDSDGDGLTNGEELGDPCGQWRIGDPQPRVAVVSDPGDADNTLDVVDAHACPPLEVAPAPDANAGLADGSSAACSAGGAAGRGGGAGSWAVLSLCLTRLLRPRRRR